jgi:hypothetical protein
MFLHHLKIQNYKITKQKKSSLKGSSTTLKSKKVKNSSSKGSPTTFKTKNSKEELLE